MFLFTTPTEARALAAAAADHSAYTLPPDKLAAAQSLAHSGVALHFLAELWPILILLFLLSSGTAARMRNVANNISKNRWLQGLTFSFELLTLFTLLNLPIALYARHRLLAYGLSVQTFPSWLHDAFITYLLTLVFGTLGVMGVFALIRRFPRRWWFPTWLAFCILTIIGFFAVPYVIDPLFNHFDPLEQSNPALVARFEQVIARTHAAPIPPSRMFLMHASNKTTQLNAYVTGIGASKRIVVWDTSIAKGTPDEITFIFAHELGHYVLGHILSGLLWTFAISLVSFFLAFHLFQFLLARNGKSWRIVAIPSTGGRAPIPAQQNWAALVVILLAISLISIIEEPIQNFLSRQHEHNADVFGQEAVQSILPNPQQTGQAAFDLLGTAGLATPTPNAAYVFWTYSHPSTALRAAFALHYTPYAPDSQPKYLPKP